MVDDLFVEDSNIKLTSRLRFKAIIKFNKKPRNENMTQVKYSYKSCGFNRYK